MFSKIDLFDLGLRSFVAKMFKRRVQKTNQVAGDFIHTHFFSF